MRNLLITLSVIVATVGVSFLQEEEIIKISKDKWEWMVDKNVDKLANLFDDGSKFVYISGTWNKDRELEIIKNSSIWYKNADVKEVVLEFFDSTDILWNRITLV